MLCLVAQSCPSICDPKGKWVNEFHPCNFSITLASTGGSSTAEIIDSTHTQMHWYSFQNLLPTKRLDTDGVGAWFLPFVRNPINHLRTLRGRNRVHSLQVQFSSVHVDSLRSHEPQHARPPCPSPTPGVYWNQCPLSRWCHPTISSSVVPFSSCPQSFPASGSFQMSQLFTSGGQSIGVSASASVLPMNTQDWSPFEWTGWISLQSKGLSRVFSNTTVQKHPFFGAQLSSQSNSHM